MMENKILLIEDDSEIRTMVQDYLTGEKFQVTSFCDGGSAMREISGDNRYDLVLIDLMLPDMSGMEIIKKLRRVSTVPIIIVTAKDNDIDKTFGLNLGADDYVVKPFSLVELTARIRANIRRAQIYPSARCDEIIKIRDLEINVDRHSVRRDGKALDFTRTEFEILSLLAAHPGQAFSKERLYELIWKEPYFGNENVLNTHMNRLRMKLKKNAKDDVVYIKTLWGIGYKMEEL